MKKKVLAFLLATSMLISMTGCDKKRNTGVDDNKDEKVTTATDNPVNDEKKTADASADTTDADSKDNNDKVNLLDINNMNVIKDIVVKAKGGSEINFCDERICVRNIENENSIVYLYDMDLNKIDEIKLKVKGLFFPNEPVNAIYYCNNGELMKYDIKDRKAKKVALEDDYNITYIEGIVTDDKGTDYAVMNVDATNGKNYEAVIDVSKGKTKKLLSGTAVYTKNVSNGTIIFDKDMDSTKDSIVINLNGDAAIYTKNNQYEDEMSVLADKRIISVLCNKYTMELMLYDNGKMTSSSKITVSVPENVKKVKPFVSDDGEENKELTITCKPEPVGDGNILISCKDLMNNIYFILWKPKDANVSKKYDVKSIDFDSVKSEELDNVIDIKTYVPSELSENLKPLREKADKIEKKHGIKIEIGQPCKNVIGGYAINDLTEYNSIDDALDALEVQLKRYPDNFFSQFKYDSYKGLLVYLSGTIQGTTSESLSYANGIQNEYNGYMLMVINASSRWNVETTFNHELSHSIEDKIYDTYGMNDDYCLDDDKWNELNPSASNEDSVYTYNYNKLGYEDCFKYSADYSGTNKETYFVDSYSMTYPTEDRAKLFEEIMTNAYGIDIDKAPHLKEKMKYYATCIRTAFDTTGWNDVCWER